MSVNLSVLHVHANHLMKSSSSIVDTVNLLFLVPIVLGYFGVVSSKQQTYLKQIPNYNEYLFSNLLKATILGTINILQLINFGNTSACACIIIFVLYCCA